LYVPVLPIHVTNITGSLETVGIILSAYAIAQLLLRIPIGLLADKIGNKKLSLIAILLSSLGSILLMMSNNANSLFLSRTLTGLAAAGWVPISILYSSYFTSENTDKSMSEIVMINSIGLLSATYMGGILAEKYGINFVFVTAFIFGIISLICMSFSQEVKKMPIDNHHIQNPIQKLKKTMNKNLMAICVVGSCLFYLTFSTIYGFIPIYLEKLGSSETMIGFIIAFSLGASLYGAFLLPKLNNKFSYKIVICNTWLLMIVTTLITPITNNVMLIILLQFFCGIGRGIMTALLMSLVIKQSSMENKSTSMGIYQSLYSVGMFVGPFLSGIIAAMTKVESIFYLAAIICIFGMFVSILFVKPLEYKQNRI
tara:strand:+ start:4548 stop:5654 length:1107 start_codon:yes stop_codon:yes gene_type:complete